MENKIFVFIVQKCKLFSKNNTCCLTVMNISIFWVFFTLSYWISFIGSKMSAYQKIACKTPAQCRTLRWHFSKKLYFGNIFVYFCQILILGQMTLPFDHLQYNHSVISLGMIFLKVLWCIIKFLDPLHRHKLSQKWRVII